jgi:hypothetical protein
MYFLKFSLSLIFISTLFNSSVFGQQADTAPKILLTPESGFYIQAGKFITSTLEPTVRVSFLNPEDELQHASGSFLQRDIYTLGFNNFLRGHAIKLQVDANVINETVPANTHNVYLQLLTQFSISF